MHSVVTALEKIAFNDDPLKFTLIETSYQPFISLFHMMGFVDEHPSLKAIRELFQTLYQGKLYLN
jgi:lysosomal acid phosphatase